MSQNMKRALGAILAEVREKAGLSQEQMAERAETNAAQPSRWETGARWPQDIDIAAYSEATDTPIEDIWMRACRRCINLALTQHAGGQAARSQRRHDRLSKRSRRNPPATPNQPADD